MEFIAPEEEIPTIEVQNRIDPLLPISTPISTSTPTNKNELSYADLSLEQKYAMMKFTNGDNIFLTGSGGTGKSKLVQYMVKCMGMNGKKYQVCAMTGCAAVLLNVGATTIHSWSGIGLGKQPKEKIAYYLLKKNKYLTRWREVQVLILDEVSMLSVHIFEMLDYIGKVLRKNPAPFGGIQLVFCGDFFQLPPIGNSNEPKTSMFCFEAENWLKTFPMKNHIELKQVFRQKDPVYIDILQNVRKGIITEEHANILKSRVNAEYNEDEFNGCIPTKLFAIRSKAEHINTSHYNAIQDEEHVYKTNVFKNCTIQVDSGRPLNREELRSADHLSQEQIGFEIEGLITNSARTHHELRLKIGTVVMCTINYDLDHGICNGSQGIIIEFKKRNLVGGSKGAGQLSELYTTTFDYIPIVKFSNGYVMSIYEHVWQSDEYPTLAIVQIPLVMAWAMTIHKIQGATLGVAEMDLGKSVFEYGQSYVALSRVQNLSGLFLNAFNPSKIRANPKVVQFYNTFISLTQEEMALAVHDVEEKECDEDTTKTVDFHRFEYNSFSHLSIAPTDTNSNIKRVHF